MILLLLGSGGSLSANLTFSNGVTIKSGLISSNLSSTSAAFNQGVLFVTAFPRAVFYVNVTDNINSGRLLVKTTKITREGFQMSIYPISGSVPAGDYSSHYIAIGY